MKKLGKLTLLAAASMVLASCGAPARPTGDFKEKLSEGLHSFAYTANYDVEIDAHGGDAPLDSFKHKVRDTIVGEFDLTEGSKYLYVKSEKQDIQFSQDITTVEYLITKNGAGSYELHQSDDFFVASEDTFTEETVVDAIYATIKEATYNLAGYVNENSFAYGKKENMYLWHNFGLDSETTGAYEGHDIEGLVPELFWADPSYETLEDGYKFTSYPAAIGYRTDGGLSDFPSKEGGNTKIEVTVDKEGVVNNYVETLDQVLDFDIGIHPTPTVVITGTRQLTVEHDVTITKKTSIEYLHDKAIATVKVDSGVTAYKLQTMLMNPVTGAPAGAPVDVADPNNIALQENQILMVVPTLEGDKEVKAVKVNGQNAASFNGMYYISCSTEGFYNFEIATKAKTTGKVTYTLDEGVTAHVYWITYPDFTPNEFTSGAELTPGPAIFVIVDSIVGGGVPTFNGVAMTQFNTGVFGSPLAKGGTYTVVVPVLAA